ncbi:MAG: hypothetical protein FWE53_00470 [Firmicutes bacterium]|nr:hypothetical protein [Bacillota bacterium]
MNMRNKKFPSKPDGKRSRTGVCIAFMFLFAVFVLVCPQTAVCAQSDEGATGARQTLTRTIETHSKIKRSMYPYTAYAEFEGALISAQTALNNPDSSETVLEAHISNLHAARANLQSSGHMPTNDFILTIILIVVSIAITTAAVAYMLRHRLLQKTAATKQPPHKRP